MGAVLGTVGRGTWLVVRVLLRVVAGAVLLGFGTLTVGGGAWALLQSGGLWDAVGGVLFATMGIAVGATGVIVLLGLRSVGKPGETTRNSYDGRHGSAYGAYGGSYGDGLGGGSDCGGSGFGGGGGDGGGGC